MGTEERQDKPKDDDSLFGVEPYEGEQLTKEESRRRREQQERELRQEKGSPQKEQ